ncbi:hypothetical protein ES703_52543 [subsurface metagenome]
MSGLLIFLSFVITPAFKCSINLWGWKFTKLSRGAGDAVPAIQSDEDAVSKLINLPAERKGKS